MKKFIVVLVALFMIQLGTVTAQGDVPAAVTKAFKAKYPKAEYSDWVKNNGVFTVTFWEGDFYKEANYETAGTWIETFTVVEEDALPEAVKSGLQSSLGEVFISYINLHETPGKSNYVIDLTTETENLKVTIDTSGKIVKKETVESDDDGDGF